MYKSITNRSGKKYEKAEGRMGYGCWSQDFHQELLFPLDLNRTPIRPACFWARGTYHVLMHDTGRPYTDLPYTKAKHTYMWQSISFWERTEGFPAGCCSNLHHSDKKERRPLLLQGHVKWTGQDCFTNGKNKIERHNYSIEFKLYVRSEHQKSMLYSNNFLNNKLIKIW